MNLLSINLEQIVSKNYFYNLLSIHYSCHSWNCHLKIHHRSSLFSIDVHVVSIVFEDPELLYLEFFIDVDWQNQVSIGTILINAIIKGIYESIAPDLVREKGGRYESSSVVVESEIKESQGTELVRFCLLLRFILFIFQISF